MKVSFRFWSYQKTTNATLCTVWKNTKLNNIGSQKKSDNKKYLSISINNTHDMQSYFFCSKMKQNSNLIQKYYSIWTTHLKKYSIS